MADPDGTAVNIDDVKYKLESGVQALTISHANDVKRKLESGIQAPNDSRTDHVKHKLESGIQVLLDYHADDAAIISALRNIQNCLSQLYSNCPKQSNDQRCVKVPAKRHEEYSQQGLEDDIIVSAVEEVFERSLQIAPTE